MIRIEELKGHVVLAPPPFTKATVKPPVETKGMNSSNQIFKWVAISLCTLGIAVMIYIYLVPKKPQPGQTTSAEPPTEQLQNDLVPVEPGEANKFLVIEDPNMHNNLIGQKIIKGEIFNRSTTTSFKDIQLGIVFKSKTDTELETQRFTI